MRKASTLALAAVITVAVVAYLVVHVQRSPGVVATDAAAPAPLPGNNREQQAMETRRIVESRLSMLDSYERLVALAEAGDASAAFQLYEDASRCANLDVRKGVMEEFAAASGDSTATDAIVRQLMEDQALCAGLDAEKLARKNEWVVKAARLGNTEAQVLFFGAVTEHIKTPQDMVANAEELAAYKVEALRHLQSAAGKGSDTALFNMALAYRQGTLADQDPVAAYAYMLALENRGTVKSAGRYLETWSRGMTATEISRAEALSSRYNN